MAAALVTLVPRSGSWSRLVADGFSRLDKGVIAAEQQAVKAVMGGRWQDIYRKGLSRPENRRRGLPPKSGRPQGLLEAYRNAVKPLSSVNNAGSSSTVGKATPAKAGQGFFDPAAGRTVSATAVKVSFLPTKRRGIGVGDIGYLRQNAAHWRAIELGSDHITSGRNRIIGFGTRDAAGRLAPWPPNQPDPSSVRQDPDAVVMPASRAFLWQQQNPGAAIAKATNPIHAKHYLRDIAEALLPVFATRISFAFDHAGFD